MLLRTTQKDRAILSVCLSDYGGCVSCCQAPFAKKRSYFSWRLPPRELPLPPARVNPYTQSFYQTMRKISMTCSDKRCQYHIWKSASSSGARAFLPLPELPTYDAHEGDIIIHKAAKKAFDELALKKIAHRQSPASGVFRSACAEETRLCGACQGTRGSQTAPDL